MPIVFTEEQELFRRSVATFVDKELLPVADSIDASCEIPPALFRRMGELGFYGVKYPEEYGGSSGDTTMLCVLCEELARGSASVCMGAGGQALMNTYCLYHYGTEEQKRQILMPAIAGEKIGAWSLTEPNTGSDISGIQTVAHRTPGGYRLSGRKTWITTGVAPDYVIVAAKTDRSKRAEGLSLFLVPKETPGFSVARRIETLGVRASHTMELLLDECELPEDHLLGGEGNGMEYIRLVMAEARLITGAIALGIARAALDASLTYSHERQQFGQPIAKFQAIKFRLADMATDLEAARYMVYGAAKLSDQGLPCVKEAAMAKLFASETVMRITDSAARIYASYGFAMEYPIQRYLRDARVTIIGGGTSEIMRHVIGKEMGL